MNYASSKIFIYMTHCNNVKTQIFNQRAYNPGLQSRSPVIANIIMRWTTFSLFFVFLFCNTHQNYRENEWWTCHRRELNTLYGWMILNKQVDTNLISKNNMTTDRSADLSTIGDHIRLRFVVLPLTSLRSDHGDGSVCFTENVLFRLINIRHSTVGGVHHTANGDAVKSLRWRGSSAPVRTVNDPLMQHAAQHEHQLVTSLGEKDPLRQSSSLDLWKEAWG